MKWELAQTKRELLKEKGKEKYQETVGRPSEDDKSLSINDNEKHDTRKEISKELGWSTGKVAQAEQVWDKELTYNNPKYRKAFTSLE